MLKTTEANLWPLEVLQDAHGLVQLEGNLTDEANAALVVVVGAVGKVETQGGGTGFNQRSQHIGVAGCRADRCHNLGTAQGMSQLHNRSGVENDAEQYNKGKKPEEAEPLFKESLKSVH